MKLIDILIIAVLFVFGVFLISPLETSIGGIGAETLQPVLSIIPILFIGGLFLAIIYLGFKD